MNFRIKQISQNSKLKSELDECKQKLVGEEEEIKRLHKKIQKISRENVELGRSLRKGIVIVGLYKSVYRNY